MSPKSVNRLRKGACRGQNAHAMKQKKIPSTPAAQVSGGRKFSKAKVIASRFGICSRTVFRLADRGLIHRHKLNPRVVLFDEAEVEALVASARVA